jgi:DNA excision repair protein ERCC-4
METFATQTQTVPQGIDRETDVEEDEDEDNLQEVTSEAPPPVFRPLMFDADEDLTASVKKRMRKGHDSVLEEQPKWSLLAKVLKEIEDTIARVTDTHAGLFSFRV